MKLDHETSPTFVIRHAVAAADRAAYEAWVKEIGDDARRFDGHLGAEIIRPQDGPGVGEYTIVIRFDTEENLLAWAGSEVRARHIEAIAHLLQDGDRVEVHSGIDFWFTPPAARRHARPWKQFLVTFSVIYPLVLFVPLALGPALDLLPEAGGYFARTFVVVAVVVALAVFVIMPRYTRAVAGWLFDRDA